MPARQPPAVRIPQDDSYWIEHHADLLLVLAVSNHLGVKLAPAELTLDGGIRVGVHGFAADGRVLVQCAADRGEIKSAHRNMALASALRLVWLRTAYYPQARAILAFGPRMQRLLVPGAWLPAALDDLGVEVLVVAEDGRVTPPA